MQSAKPIYIYPAFAFEGYANRDSTPYSQRYNIPEAKTIIRGTLRYQVMRREKTPSPISQNIFRWVFIH